MNPCRHRLVSLHAFLLGCLFAVLFTFSPFTALSISDESMRVAGGTQVGPGETPFVVQIRLNKAHWCAGLIYNSQWIVTTAECVLGHAANTLTVVVGQVSLTSPDSGEQTITVSDVAAHPGYLISTHVNNIAMLKLSRPIALDGPYAKAIPISPLDDISLDNAPIVLGWGSPNRSALLQDVMHQTTVPLRGDDCSSPYGTGWVSGSMICAGDGTYDACSGDIGDPLVQLPVGGSSQLLTDSVAVGILSTFRGSCLDYPSVYTRLSAFSNWMTNVAGEQPITPTTASATGGGCPPDTAVIDPCVCSINVNGDVVLSCNNKNLDDSTISNILFNYVLNQGLNSPLALLNLNTNQLTRVPSGIANLPNLVGLFMDDNQVTTLPNDTTTFDPQTKLKYLSLANNQMTLVEAGALPGIGGDGSIFNFASNRLATFDEDVFYPVLLQMSGVSNAYLDVTGQQTGFQCTVDPNDLENTCTIAWLIKYNPNLLNSVRGGTCDDGTAFNLVDSAAYDQCPVITPPFSCPQPNGNFADPSNCRQYYLCADGQENLLTCCPLAFNPDKAMCDLLSNLPTCTATC